MNASPRIRLYFEILSNKIPKRDLPERTGPFVNYIRIIRLLFNSSLGGGEAMLSISYLQS